MKRYERVFKEARMPRLSKDEIICDYCEHYSPSPSGTDEGLPVTCWQFRSKVLSRSYVEDRLDGVSINCTEFSEI